MNLSTLPLPQLRTDGGTQLRQRLDGQTLLEYSEALLRGDAFPPVVVFHDGQDHWLADGFHRHEAARRAGLSELGAEVRPGTRREAVLYAAGANAQHGLRRTTADKRRAIETLLRDEEWGGWSDREIARRCGVDHKTVSQVRRELSGEIPQIERTVRRGESVYQQHLRGAGSERTSPGPEAPVSATVDAAIPGLPDVQRLLAEAAPPRPVYPGEWLGLGRHRLHCGELAGEACRRRILPAQLAVLVAGEGTEAEARRVEELAQFAERVAALTTRSALPGLTRHLRLPQAEALAVLHEGPAPRRAEALHYWTPVLLCGQQAPRDPAPDLLRVPDPPRDSAPPFRPSYALLRLLVEQLSRPGQTVLATERLDELLLLAEQSGRNYLGVSPDPRLIGSAITRWERLTGSQSQVLLR